MLPTRTADHPLSRYHGSDNATRARLATQAAVDPAAGAAAPGVSVIILNLDRPDLLLPLLDVLAAWESRLAGSDFGFEVVVGDTGSSDPEVLAAYRDRPPWLRVLSGLDYQFSRCNNRCVAEATPFDRILLLNNDVIATSPDPFLAMSAELDKNPETGVVGLCLDFPDGTVQHRGMELLRTGPLRGFPFHPQAKQAIDHREGQSFPAVATTGACLMIRTAIWEAVGGLDEAYESECQDIDLCLSAHRLGWGVRVVDAGPVVHLENATRPAGDESWPDRRLLSRRWQSFTEARFL